MAISLAAIGAGLGQGIEQIYRQKQQQAALDQLRRQAQAEALIGALPGSTYMPTNSPFGSRIPTAQTGPLNTAPPAAAAAPQPTPPMGGGTPGIANATGAGSGATGALPLDDTPESQVQADVANEDIAQGRNAPASPAPASPAPTGGGAAADTSTHSPEVHAAAEAVGVSPSHQIQFSDQQYNQIAESLFRQPLTFGELVSRMQKARPGADPGTIGRAAIMTYKLIEQGDAAQNNMGFRVLSSLAALDRLKEQSRHNVAQEGLGTARIGATERGQDIRADTAAAGRAAAGERQDKSIAAADARAAANRNASYQRMLTREGHVDARQARALADRAVQQAQAQGNRATASRISAIRAQIAAIAAKSPAPGSADQQKLDDLGKQLSDLAGSLGGQ